MARYKAPAKDVALCDGNRKYGTFNGDTAECTGCKRRVPVHAGALVRHEAVDGDR